MLQKCSWLLYSWSHSVVFLLLWLLLFPQRRSDLFKAVLFSGVMWFGENTNDSWMKVRQAWLLICLWDFFVCFGFWGCPHPVNYSWLCTHDFLLQLLTLNNYSWMLVIELCAIALVPCFCFHSGHSAVFAFYKHKLCNYT